MPLLIFLPRGQSRYLRRYTRRPPPLSIMIVDNDLVINKNPLKTPGIHAVNLMKKLKRKGITGLEFEKGIKKPEILQFIDKLSSPERAPIRLPHIKTGVIDVRLGGLKIEGDLEFDPNDAAAFRKAQLEKAREFFTGFSPFKKLHSSGLEEIVMNFILTFRREANILSLISPVRTYSEYTYTHATNVSVLSMFQAETLGVDDELLHDIGIAALLHDVGKLFISEEILEKKGALNDEEWDEIRKHTLYGARYLATVEGIPRLAPVVALEHHLRYDGKGYPQLRWPKKQHIVSQIVAISDFFDALRSRRPYKRDWSIKDILVLLKEGAGAEFNPELVDNFSRSLGIALKR
ncbi:MAG: HD domain-containing protein [Nitrospirae bacterium]|nr:MAG: HD domain-containing protein [Nitrospirota bacterium]